MPGNCSIFRSWNTGDLLTASDLTTSFTTVGVQNLTPTCMDDYAVDLVQFKLATDPYPSGVPDLPTSLAGELERIRFVLKKMFGFSQWYTNTEPINFPNSVGTLTVDGNLTITNASTVTGLGWRKKTETT